MLIAEDFLLETSYVVKFRFYSGKLKKLNLLVRFSGFSVACVLALIVIYDAESPFKRV